MNRKNCHNRIIVNHVIKGTKMLVEVSKSSVLTALIIKQEEHHDVKQS
jgi:hypothetical protein